MWIYFINKLLKSQFYTLQFYILTKLFMAVAIAKLDFAIACRDSFVISGIACISLNRLQCSLNSWRISLPSFNDEGGRLSLQTATMLDTMVMICVKFSFKLTDTTGLRTDDKTLWIACLIDSDWASRYGYPNECQTGIKQQILTFFLPWVLPRRLRRSRWS